MYKCGAIPSPPDGRDYTIAPSTSSTASTAYTSYQWYKYKGEKGVCDEIMNDVSNLL